MLGRCLARTLMCATSLAEHKAAMRKSVRATLGGLSAEAVAAASRAACERVLAHDAISECKSVSVYLAMPNGECQTDTILRSLFDAGKDVYIPRVIGSLLLAHVRDIAAW